MVQCESAKVVLFEWSHPRISSTDLKVRMTTDLGITSSRHERVKESPFALLLPPVLWEVGLQNLLSSSSYPLSYGWLGTESSFPLPPTPCLMGDRVRNLLFLFLLPPFLWVTGYGIFFSSSSYPLSWLFQFSDHRRTIQTVRGMVMSLTTFDLIHLLFL